MEQSYMDAIRKLLEVTDGEEIATIYPTYEDGARGVVFAVLPGAGDAPKEQMIAFLSRVVQDG